METKKQLKDFEEHTDIGMMEVGTEDMPKLSSKDCVVKSYLSEIVEGHGRIVALRLTHPDKETDIKITRVKYEDKNQIKISGMWIKQDSVGFIQKNSTLGRCLRYYGCSKPIDMVGKTVKTTPDINGYLCIKAY